MAPIRVWSSIAAVICAISCSQDDPDREVLVDPPRDASHDAGDAPDGTHPGGDASADDAGVVDQGMFEVGVDMTSPTPSMPLKLTNVSASDLQGCGIDAGGAVFCWGARSPAADSGPVSDAPFPWDARTVTEGAAAMFGGGGMMCAVREVGDVACWGANSTAGFDDTDEPRVVLDRRAVAMSIDDTICAIDEEGQLWCWGDGDDDKLPGGASSTMPTPLFEGTVFDDVVTLRRQVCGVTDGRLVCWGWGRYSTDQVEPTVASPVEIDLAAEPVAVARWRDVLTVLDADGAVWDVAITDAEVPLATRVAGIDPLVQIDGEVVACGVSDSGDVWCWGGDVRWALNVTRDDSAGPLRFEFPEPVTSVSVGGDFACAESASENVYCIGASDFGQHGETPSLLMPTRVFDQYRFSALTIGEDICGLTIAGEVVCTEVSRGDPRDPLFDWVTIATPEPVIRIGGEGANTCGLTASGDLYCWGVNTYGALGVLAQEETGPIRVPISEPVLDFDAYGGTTCAVTATRTLCWGWHYSDGDSPSTSPNAVGAVIEVPYDTSFDRIALSTAVACGLDNGLAHCWRPGYSPTEPDQLTRPELTDSPPVFDELDGGSLMCGLDATGTTFCWSIRYPDTGGLSGQDPGEVGVSAAEPTDVGAPPFAAMSASNGFGCGIGAADRRAYCWGRNYIDAVSGGQLGNGTRRSVFSPTAVIGGPLEFADVTAGHGRACALNDDGEAWCWGNNRDARLAPNHGPTLLRRR